MIVGISGLAGSGKDTCADFLVREHGFQKVSFADPLKRVVLDIYDFSRAQLWGPSAMRNAPDERYPREHGPHVKHEGPSHDREQCQCCGAVYHLGEPFPYSDGTPRCYLTPRFALQQLGTEWGRHCYPNTWVDYALRTASAIEDGCWYDATHLHNTIFRRMTPSNGNVVIPDVRFKNEVDALRAAGAKLIRIVRPGAGLAGSAGSHVSETEQSEIPDSAFDAVIFNNGTISALGEAAVRWLK